ncbi:MAG TPA: hypothetical protein VHB30_00655 [Solirubrobacteraceae bacterium]|nr:hypothetical protein [Solirubrobacteraceae bacterium]
MPRLRLSFACADYDRTRALVDGRVRPEGIELVCLGLPVEETFFRMMRHQEFDVAELSLSSYVLSCLGPERPFVGIPVFPSRSFRHGSVYVNAHAGVRTPADLRGRIVGVPEWQLTALVWIRGLLAEEYDLPIDAVEYRTGGLEEPGRVEKAAVSAPDGVRIEPIAPHRTLARLLADGELAAIYSPRAPSTLGGGDVVRLFDDLREREREYFERTRIFPIMHVIAIRRTVYERDPWVARSLLSAFEAAKERAVSGLCETAALTVMLPWLTAELDATRELMGDDWWSYGLEPNRHVLEKFLLYATQQGIATGDLAPEDLFVPEALESYRV